MIKLKSRIGPKGQVVVPKPIRDSFGLRPGGFVYFYTRDDEVVLGRDDEKVLERFFSFPKRKMPQKMDWDKLYYSQFEE